MSWLSKLFGGGAKSEARASQAESYKDFAIYVEPMSEAGGYRIAARIEKQIDGTLRTHQMIRADVCNSAEEAHSISLNKAKSVIDQLGDHIFD